MNYSKKIDQKWQKKWDEIKLNDFILNKNKEKCYVLEMFSYPSSSKIHIGHWYNFSIPDSYARMKLMQGYNVFHPMGFDSFGLPAENYAIKTGIHPKISTNNNINTMRVQLKEMGAMINFDHTLETHDPKYYRWTQWLFSTLYKNGLAYRAYAPVNWCDSCKTVLANEQVVDGACERCGTEVYRRNLNQWFFKITKYADELLNKIDDLNWPEKTKKIQKNWIGRSSGAKITFKTDTNIDLTVFTTRPDTLFGVSYLVLAPENDNVELLTTVDKKDDVHNYQEEAKKANEIERTSTTREKTGVFTGSYAYNPINNKKIPIWISDYVINSYGTGCVMAVPAHDDRDYEFAKNFDLEIIKVIESEKLPFVDEGLLINSQEFNGFNSSKAKDAIVNKLVSMNCGEHFINYRLKDWLVSRQRYWGAPIPIIYCDDCGEVLVPDQDLPILLPENVDFRPDGESPLKRCEEFVNCACPKCGKPAKRETDTLDTFVCSSWYYLRYTDPNNNNEAFNKELTNSLLPVDVYVGGAEHATMHLIYARFITKVLRDLGFLNFDEPFSRMIHQGMILGSDGSKMSKSKNNSVSPDEYVDQYGSDVFRLSLMFGYTYTEGGPWSEDGIKSLSRFVNRIDNIQDKIYNNKYKLKTTIDKLEKDIQFIENKTIKSVTDDINNFSFNTAIARCMEYINELYRYEQSNEMKNIEFIKNSFKKFIKLFAPLAPHFSEEIWEKMGNNNSIFYEKYPEYDESHLVKDNINLPIQINGKLVGVVNTKNNATEQEVSAIIEQDEKLSLKFKDKIILKVIYIPKRVYNIVVK